MRSSASTCFNAACASASPGRARSAAPKALRARCFDAGCDDFVTKPIDRPKLFAALDRQLAARKPTTRS